MKSKFIVVILFVLLLSSCSSSISNKEPLESAGVFEECYLISERFTDKVICIDNKNKETKEFTVKDYYDYLIKYEYYKQEDVDEMIKVLENEYEK